MYRRRSELEGNMKKNARNMYKDAYDITRKPANCVTIDAAGLLVAR